MVSSQLEFRKIPWHLLLIFLILAIGIGFAGHFYYQNQKRAIGMDRKGELSAIADLKSQQIANWRKERIADARAIQKNPFIAPEIQKWLKYNSALDRKQTILNWIASLVLS